MNRLERFFDTEGVKPLLLICLILLLTWLLSGCAKKVEVKDILKGEVPKEIAEICLVESADSAVDCYNYSLGDLKWLTGDEGAAVTSYPSICEASYPGYYMRPDSILAIRRMLGFLLPQAYRFLHENSVPPEMFDAWLEKELEKPYWDVLGK